MPLSVELPVLRGFLTASEAEDWSKESGAADGETATLLRALLGGDYEAVLLSLRVVDVLSGGDWEGEELVAGLERRLLLFLSEGGGQQQSRELTLMAVAAACLHLFAQSNWTGPPSSLRVWDLLPPSLLSQNPRLLTEAIHSSLLLDGEAVYSLVVDPLLLLLARLILTSCSARMEHLQLLPWWTLRYVSLHQQILEARSAQLLSLACCSMESVMRCQSLLSNQRSLAVQFHMECVYISLTYYEYSTAKEHISRAKELCGLHVNMTGALGKRTRFQEKLLAQLVVEVKRQDDEAADWLREATPTPTPKASLPKDLCLDDDTVLDQISLAEPEQHQVPDLCAEEQALILGVCTNFQKNNPVHKLTEEELLAFTACILSQPKFWSVEVTALCIRTRLERGKSRCIERAMMQTQVVVDHFEDQSCSASERLKVFYCCQVPPRWAVQKLLASLLIDLGCVSSALLLYEKLELWEDTIICYEKLGQHGKAEEIVRRELEKKETPTLYCLLGDILNDHQYYDRAWQLSGQRSARAMRSKALLHLRNKELQQCVDCFEHSLKINSIQLGVWFSLGCAYFALEGYEGAARAFQRCVGLEPDNAEAWNNLSTAYIRLQMKTKAFRTLQEALKCNFEHWQIWENFLVVSTDIGEFAEAIKAYHRLMDLRESFKDVQVLQILVRAVVENLTDNQGVLAGTLAPKLKELLGRVSARHSSDAEVWWQYAVLYGGGRSPDPDDNHKALQFLSKAHRCEVQASGWEKDPVLFKEVIRRAVHMGEVSIACSENRSPAEALQMLSSSRLSLRSLASKTKQIHSDMATGEVAADLQDGVAALERLISELQELSGTLRSHAH